MESQKVESDIKYLPATFSQCSTEDLVSLISFMFDRLIEHNDRLQLTPDGLTRFHSRAAPNITTRDYIWRIVHYGNVENAVLLSLLPFVDRIAKSGRLQYFTISSLTVHRFIIAGICASTKALSDRYGSNSRNAKIGGISLTEMNLLEKEFCIALDWRLIISFETLQLYYVSLVRTHPKFAFERPYEGKRSLSNPPDSPIAKQLRTQDSQDDGPVSQQTVSEVPERPEFDTAPIQMQDEDTLSQSDDSGQVDSAVTLRPGTDSTPRQPRELDTSMYTADKDTLMLVDNAMIHVENDVGHIGPEQVNSSRQSDHSNAKTQQHQAHLLGNTAGHEAPHVEADAS